jgi:hypothetical protein
MTIFRWFGGGGGAEDKFFNSSRKNASNLLVFQEGDNSDEKLLHTDKNEFVMKILFRHWVHLLFFSLNSRFLSFSDSTTTNLHVFLYLLYSFVLMALLLMYMFPTTVTSWLLQLCCMGCTNLHSDKFPTSYYLLLLVRLPWKHTSFLWQDALMLLVVVIVIRMTCLFRRVCGTFTEDSYISHTEQKCESLPALHTIQGWSVYYEVWKFFLLVSNFRVGNFPLNYWRWSFCDTYGYITKLSRKNNDCPSKILVLVSCSGTSISKSFFRQNSGPVQIAIFSVGTGFIAVW